MISILLVEDNDFFRDRLTRDLKKEPSFKNIVGASNKDEAIQLAAQDDFDIVLMDIVLSHNGYEGIDATRIITSIAPSKVIMLTEQAEQWLILEAFRNGAVDYVNKCDYRDIVRVIQNVARNDQWPTKVLSAEFRRVTQEQRLSQLTLAEREIYELKSQGLTRSQIANRLLKSEETVKVQMRSVSKKLKDLT